MFTGIIEALGIVKKIEVHGTNKTFWIEAPFTGEIKVDESIGHNGVCLTVEEISENDYRVTAILETLEKTNIDDWFVGKKVNLERSLRLNATMDGHIVQGHVDAKAICKKVKALEGSWEFTFTYDKKFAPLIIEKGSVAINGVSLTAFEVTKKKLTVAIIPFTYQHTSFSDLKEGDIVNIEFDVLGKYVARMLTLKK
ncbi:MAG: riboflavin synthase [Ginsengibacter sp.]